MEYISQDLLQQGGNNKEQGIRMGGKNATSTLPYLGQNHQTGDLMTFFKSSNRVNVREKCRSAIASLILNPSMGKDREKAVQDVTGSIAFFYLYGTSR